MGIFDIIAGSVSPVEVIEQWTAPAGTTILAGNAVYRHQVTGWAFPCGSANAAEGIAIVNAQHNSQVITAVRKGLIDLGGSALTPYTMGTTIFVHGHWGGSALGSLGVAPTPAGTFPVGNIVPVFVSHPGTTGGTVNADRLLHVDL